VLPGENGNPGARVIERSRQEFLPRSLDDLRSSVVKIGPTSGCRLRIPFGVLGLLSSFVPQFALNAGMRRHDLTIRLCQSV
jgi:hypothetical protein